MTDDQVVRNRKKNCGLVRLHATSTWLIVTRKCHQLHNINQSINQIQLL